LESWEPPQHLLLDPGKPRKTCVEVAGSRIFRILTLLASCPSSKVKISVCCWQLWTLPWHVVAMANKFFTVASNISRSDSRHPSAIWNFKGLPKIFLKILCISALIHVVIRNQAARSEKATQILSHQLHSTNSVQIKMAFSLTTCFHDVKYFGTTAPFNVVTVVSASDSTEFSTLRSMQFVCISHSISNNCYNFTVTL
jgi:hypothetical protein